MSSSLGAALNGEYPEEDSEDLTDAEIAEAVSVAGPTDIVDHLAGLRCQTCEGEGKLHVLAHVFRRRKPHLYWRVTLGCKNGHQQHAKMFLTDWI